MEPVHVLAGWDGPEHPGVVVQLSGPPDCVKPGHQLDWLEQVSAALADQASPADAELFLERAERCATVEELLDLIACTVELI